MAQVVKAVDFPGQKRWLANQTVPMAAPDAPAHVPTEQSAQSIPASDHPSGDGLQQPPMPVGPNGEVVGYPVMNVGQIMGGPAGGAVPPEYATYVLGGMPVAPPQTFQQNGETILRSVRHLSH